MPGLTALQAAAQVIEALDPLAIGEEVSFFFDMLNYPHQLRRRGIIIELQIEKHHQYVLIDDGTGHRYAVQSCDIIRDK